MSLPGGQHGHIIALLVLGWEAFFALYTNHRSSQNVRMPDPGFLEEKYIMSLNNLYLVEGIQTDESLRTKTGVDS